MSTNHDGRAIHPADSVNEPPKRTEVDEALLDAVSTYTVERYFK
jgi:hypothetical protein